MQQLLNEQFLEKKVQKMYSLYPYPSLGVYNSSYNIKTHANHILKSLGKKTTNFNSKHKILDAGCGTGEITCSLAFNGAKTLGIDFTQASLNRARHLAEKHNLKNVKFEKQNLLNLNLGNQKFDYVFAIGSLHHTLNPKKVFANLSKYVKLNGFITLGLYNFYGRFLHRLKRNFVNLFAQSVNEKINLAGKLFSNYSNLGEQQKIYLADKFANPIEKYFSLEEIFSWFKEFDFEFYSSYPKIKNGSFLTQLNWFLKKKTFFFVSGKKL